ncbi:MAG: hypothetical protein ACOCT9_02485 [archaeon]
MSEIKVMIQDIGLLCSYALLFGFALGSADNWFSWTFSGVLLIIFIWKLNKVIKSGQKEK